MALFHEYDHSPRTTSDYPESNSFYSYDDATASLLGGEQVDLEVLPAVRLSRRLFTRSLCSKARLNRTPPRSCICARRTPLRKVKTLSYSLFIFLGTVVLAAFIFFPSYTNPPVHYKSLRRRATTSTAPGRGNANGQKIFIASSLYDPGGHLASGTWGNNLLRLIDLLGPENTYLSIYENDSGRDGKLALAGLNSMAPCNKSLVSEDHLAFQYLPTVILPDGSRRVKRIAYLAEVRNKVLEPLNKIPLRFDKVLYLNDVFFDPIDALQLLFSTNLDQSGRATYRAACAVDFISPFKFYDTFATRDLGGFSMGVPFFPWFSYGGDRRTYSDVLRGKDAVRVKSCWGGMVAFDAKFFQSQPITDTHPTTAGKQSPSNLTGPYRFRAEQDLYWDASECCLIHADIQGMDPGDTGIYMNPFVRCAYDEWTQSWLWFTRRFERLYTPIHFLIDLMVSLPRSNPRRAERSWQKVDEEVWVPEAGPARGGSFQTVSRIAGHSGFCGRRRLPVMKDLFRPGGKNYEFIPIPES